MLQQITQSLELIIQQTQANSYVLMSILLIVWAVFIITSLMPQFLYLGIIPRRLAGLPGIFFSPLLHANFNHIFFNSIPLVVLSNFLLIHGIDYFIFVTIVLTLSSGFLLWCFGKPGLHIGASGLITAYWALLVSDVYYQPTNMTTIILGLISAYYFAGIFLNVFPSKRGVSWEGHFFGLISGFLLSFFMKDVIF